MHRDTAEGEGRRTPLGSPTLGEGRTLERSRRPRKKVLVSPEKTVTLALRASLSRPVSCPEQSEASPESPTANVGRANSGRSGGGASVGPALNHCAGGIRKHCEPIRT